MKVVQITAVPTKNNQDEVVTALYALTEDGRLWVMYPYPVGWTEI